MFVASYLECLGFGLKLNRNMVSSHTSVFPRITFSDQFVQNIVGFGHRRLFLMEQIFFQSNFEYFIGDSWNPGVNFEAKINTL